jgi:hypothetical protein
MTKALKDQILKKDDFIELNDDIITPPIN